MIDYYSECEMGVAKLLSALDIFDEGSVTQGDYSPLDTGKENVCVLNPGAFESAKTGETKVTQWEVTLDLFQRFSNSKTAFAKFRKMRSEVINQLDTHPSLHLEGVEVRGVLNVVVSSGDLPTFVIKENTNVTTHIVQTLTVGITQVIDIVGGEY